MNFSSKKIIILSIIAFFIFIPFLQINADTAAEQAAGDKTALEEVQKGLIKSANTAELTNEEPNGTISNKTDEIRTMIGNIIGYILAMVGVILLVQIIFAGYSWMMSGGNEEKIKKAKDKILHSIIGLAIILAAYILVSSIFSMLLGATTPTSG